jgi:hypothetical protein
MGEGSGDKNRNDGANSVPTIDLSKIVWEASLHYERGIAPQVPLKSTDLLEDAVTKLIGFYNSEYDTAEQAEPGSTAKWILPECAKKGIKSVRKIEAGDVIQIRKYWAEDADRGYFTCCAFVYDGKRAILHMDSSEPEFIDQLREREQKVNVPETVGDFANLERGRQSFVTLQISRYGRPKGRMRHRRSGRSRTAVWDDMLPAANKNSSQ